MRMRQQAEPSRGMWKLACITGGRKCTSWTKLISTQTRRIRGIKPKIDLLVIVNNAVVRRRDALVTGWAEVPEVLGQRRGRTGSRAEEARHAAAEKCASTENSQYKYLDKSSCWVENGAVDSLLQVACLGCPGPIRETR